MRGRTVRHYDDGGWGDEPRRGRGAWGFVFAIGVPLLFVGVATWWLESRFGAGVALMILGGLVGVVCVIVGLLISAAVQKFTLHSAAQFNAELAGVERTRAQTQRAELGVYREYARGEREAFAQRAKLDTVDRKELQRLVNQQARLLADAEVEQIRRQYEDERDRPSWGTVDGEFTYHE